VRKETFLALILSRKGKNMTHLINEMVGTSKNDSLINEFMPFLPKVFIHEHTTKFDQRFLPFSHEKDWS